MNILFFGIIVTLLNIIKGSNHNRCKWGSEPFHEWVNKRLTPYESLKTYHTYEMDHYKKISGLNTTEEFQVWFDNNYPWYERYEHFVELCTCNNKEKGKCYNETVFKSISDPVVVNFQKLACSWSLNGCSSTDNWVYVNPWDQCPRCKCNSTGIAANPYESKIDKWGNSECSICECSSPGSQKWNNANSTWNEDWAKTKPKLHTGALPSFKECTWVSWASKSDIKYRNATCPPRSMCVDNTTQDMWNKYVKGGTFKQAHVNINNTHVCGLTYCNENKMLKTYFENDINGGANQKIEFVHAVKNRSDFWEWSVSQGEYCSPDQWRFQDCGVKCNCPANKTNTSMTYFEKKLLPGKTVQKMWGEERNPLARDYYQCLKCNCGKSPWDQSQGPDYWSCQDIETSDNANMKCESNMLQCAGEYIGNQYQSGQWESYCTRGHGCMQYSGYEWPQYLFSGKPVPIKSNKGCERDLDCAIIGFNDQCKSAHVEEKIWRYNAKTKKIEQHKVKFTSKLKCCTTKFCNQNYNISGETCPEDKNFTKHESMGYKLLFGVGQPLIPDVTKEIGELETQAKEEAGKDEEVSGWDLLFGEFPCDNPSISKFLKHMIRSYCLYIHDWMNMVEPQYRSWGPDEFTSNMGNWKSMIEEGGCSFEPTCNFTTGKGKLKLKSNSVKFRMTLPNDVGSEDELKDAVKNTINGVAGKTVVKSKKQLSIISDTRRRRRLASGSTAEISIMSVDESSDIQSAVTAAKDDLGVNTTSIATEVVSVEVAAEETETTTTAAETTTTTQAASATTTAASSNKTTTAATTTTKGATIAETTKSNSFTIKVTLSFIVALIFSIF